MAIAFDTSGAGGFLDSLQDLGKAEAIVVFNALQHIQSNLSWSAFTTTFGWAPFDIDAMEAWPSALPMFHFGIPFGAETIEVFGRWIEPERVILVTARRP